MTTERGSAAQDKLVRAALLRAIDLFDAAWGRPYEAKPLDTRVNALLPAMRGLPPEAVQWATEAALATLEKHPVPPQLRKLAQASPAWQALLDSRSPPLDPPHVPLQCAECQEPRAQHRYLIDDAPRPFIAVLVRHRPGCVHQVENEGLAFADPPRYGQLQVHGTSWDEGQPVTVPGDAAEPEETTEQLVARAKRVTEQVRADFKAAAAGERP